MRRTTAATDTTAVRPPRICRSSTRPVFWFALALGVSLANAPILAQFPQGPGRAQPERRPGAQQPTAPASQQPEQPASAPGAPLPPGYQPPEEIPAQINLEKPLKPFPDEPGSAKEQLDKLRSQLIGFRNVLRGGSWNAEAQKLVPLWVKYNFYNMTLPENRSDLNKLSSQFQREIQSAGQLANASNAQRFRANVAREIVSRARELLDNNFAVRMQAVVTVAYLDVAEGRPYVDAADFLLEVVASDDQLQPVKIAAVNGLKRMLVLTPRAVPVETKHKIARTLVPELENADAHFWYQMRLAEALAAIDQPVTILPNGDTKPIVAQALLKVIVDKNRHWCARSHAARALGRAPLDRSVNLELIGFSLTQLANQMATAYNEDPNRWYWRTCFWDLYLAFRPQSQDEMQQYDRPGLLSRYTDPPITQAHQVILPIVRHVLSQEKDAGKPLPTELVKATTDWLQDNPPADARAFPGGEQIMSENGGAAPTVARSPVRSSR